VKDIELGETIPISLVFFLSKTTNALGGQRVTGTFRFEAAAATGMPVGITPSNGGGPNTSGGWASNYRLPRGKVGHGMAQQAVLTSLIRRRVQRILR